MKTGNRSARAVAVLITLAFIVLLSILVVSLTGSMRVERSAARFNFEKARALILAQTAIENAIAKLWQHTSPAGTNWISQPGQLIVADQAGNVLHTPIPLCSGVPSGTSLTDELALPNLNLPAFRDPKSCLITGGTSANVMSVRWIYLRKDGSLDIAEQPQTTSKLNPVVGRYAFWADDESSKVNCNIAWGRNAANKNSVSGSPTRIELTALFNFSATVADALHNHIVSSHPSYNFFDSPEDARRVGPLVAAALEENKFEVTHYNHDPDTTFFNEQRIVLTTRPDRAGWTYEAGQWIGANGLSGAAGTPRYLRILANEGTPGVFPDPGLLTNLDSAKLNETINVLLNYLQRSDWPMAPGSSFQQKYFAGNADRLTQMALNVIDYVRSKESFQLVVDPLRGAKSPGQPFTIGVSSSIHSFIGITRGPRITEVGFWLPAQPKSPATPTRFTAKLKVELYLPLNFGINEMDLTQIPLNLTARGFAADGSSLFFIINDPIVASQVGGTFSIRKGEYKTITRDIDVTYTSGRPAGSSSVFLRIAVARASDNTRLDVTPLIDGIAPNNYLPYINCPLDPPAVADTAIASMQVDDCRINTHKDDWKQAPNSFGATNLAISTIGKAPGGFIPQQDTDSTNKISDASLYMPPPAGQPGNETGMIGSAGELGYIQTGMESASKAGVPWRTLRLQPNNQAASMIPDWAFMDLFSAPVAAPNAYNKYVYAPHGSSVGGRVNLNAKAEPFGLARTRPLAAVLQGCAFDSASSATLNASQAQTIAWNIYERVLATGGKQYGYEAGYDSPGEVAEISGIADKGEQSEELIRQIANLVTTRGNVFSIYSIGQAIQQTPNGKLVVTGEQRLQSMVERYLAADVGANENPVHFATVYFRSLIP